jgi:hypothetical protein
MAVPRPVLLALLGTVLLAVTFMATMSSREEVSEQAASPVLEQQPAPTKPETQQAGLAPADAAKAIFSPGKPIDSARFDIRLNAQELGGQHERDALRMTGAFGSGQSGRLPSFNFRGSEVDDGKADQVRVLSTGDKGFFFNRGTAYAVPAAGIAAGVAFREAVAKGAQDAQVAEPDPSAWFKNLKSEGTTKINGVETAHISAVIDPRRAAADARRFARSVARTPEQPVRLPRQLDAKVKRALRSARVEAWVGTEDRILRRLTVDVRGVFPPEMLEKGDTSRWQFGLDVNLTEVNKPQQIGVPKKTSPRSPAEAYGAKQAKADGGVFALAALFADPPASLAQTSVGLIQLNQQQRARRKPRAVNRAVAQNKRVVIFFRQRGGLDDSVTDDAVHALRRRGSAVVVQDSVANVASYGQVVMSVGVTRAPSIVIIGKSGRARLIEGYIDPGALAQEVADTR